MTSRHVSISELGIGIRAKSTDDHNNGGGVNILFILDEWHGMAHIFDIRTWYVISEQYICMCMKNDISEAGIRARGMAVG